MQKPLDIEYLIAVYNSPGISIAGVARELNVAWSTADNRLVRLIEAGYVVHEVRGSILANRCTDNGIEMVRRYFATTEPGYQNAYETPKKAEPETGVQLAKDWEPEMLIKVLRCDEAMHPEGTVVCIDCNIEQITEVTDQVPYRMAAVKAAAIIHGIDPDRLLSTLDSIEAMMEAN